MSEVDYYTGDAPTLQERAQEFIDYCQNEGDKHLVIDLLQRVVELERELSEAREQLDKVRRGAVYMDWCTRCNTRRLVERFNCGEDGHDIWCATCGEPAVFEPPSIGAKKLDGEIPF